jgi:phosphoglycolate phosphatase-like HAD superfamily hydrolase
VKSDAFERLFMPFGVDLSSRVREHHERNGGMTRYDKLPLYLEWACQEASTQEVARYCQLFAVAVRQAVIDSPWVPGVREYLEANHTTQRFVIVTATPQAEIEDILQALGIADWFLEVHGAPTTKVDAIMSVLQRLKCRPQDALVIGDSQSEHKAAVAAGVKFLLRRTALNRDLQLTYDGPQCEDFVDG